VGPGPRALRLWAQLGSAGLRIADPLELFSVSATRAILDAQLLSPEDAGLLRRWLERGPHELVLFGEEGSRRVWKELCRAPRVSFLDWPPDLLDLESLGAHTPQPGDTPAEPTRSPALADPELAEVEAILGGHDSARCEAAGAVAPESPVDEPGSKAPPAPAPAGPAAADTQSRNVEEFEFDLLPEELEQLAQSGAQAPLAEPRPSGASAPAASVPDLVAPPPYFKDQVADLADIAQRIELSLELVAEADERAGLAPLEDEVRRLVQFTRTLGYLVAPPGPGNQNIDLSELVEIFLSSAVSRADDAPRCLFRGGGVLPVRSDRTLLTQALDAFFFVAQSCAESGEIVRVQTTRSGTPEQPMALITIEFPAGRLSGVPPETILSPYGLRRILPTLGPNALAAATGIFAGQGGHALLERRGEGRLAWLLEVPLTLGASKGSN
jgi:hypothetical protein